MVSSFALLFKFFFCVCVDSKPLYFFELVFAWLLSFANLQEILLILLYCYFGFLKYLESSQSFKKKSHTYASTENFALHGIVGAHLDKNFIIVAHHVSICLGFNHLFA